MIKNQAESIGIPQNAVANDWTPLWRHLHTLTLTGGRFDETLLCDMLYVRLVIHQPIRKVGVLS
jgi:hypothetical protein